MILKTKISPISIQIILVISFFAISFFAISQCSHKNSIDDDENLNIDEGILALNLKYLEGTIAFQNIILNIQNHKFLNLYQAKIDKNSSQLFLLRLKPGIYSLFKINAKTDLKNQFVQNKKQKSILLQGQINKNIFQIQPRKINYIGDIFLQFNRERTGKSLTLTSNVSNTPQKIINKKIYMSINYNRNTVKQINRQYPNLIKKYPLKNQKILFGKKEIEKTEKMLQNSSTIHSIGYGQNHYGPDDQGYQQFKWGMTIQEITNLLKKQDIQKNYYQKSENYDWIVKYDPDDSIQTYFYFAKLNDDSAEEKKLFKIRREYQKNPKTLLQEITKKHGKAQKISNGWRWEIPSTIIEIESKKDSKILIYTQKKYQNIKILGHQNPVF